MKVLNFLLLCKLLPTHHVYKTVFPTAPALFYRSTFSHMASTRVYFEKQEGMLCAQHALNNLLQGSYFNAVDLAELAKKMDEQERVVNPNLTNHSVHMDDSGFFSVQVIAEALKVFDVNLIHIPKQTLCEYVANASSSLPMAFVCHMKNHWFTLRNIDGEWYDLNSMKMAPQKISFTYLQLYLTQLASEGFSIFAVDGTLPMHSSGVNEYSAHLVEPVAANVQNDNSQWSPDEMQLATQASLAEDAELKEALLASKLIMDNDDSTLQRVIQQSLQDCNQPGSSKQSLSEVADLNNPPPSAEQVRQRRESFLRRFEGGSNQEKD